MPTDRDPGARSHATPMAGLVRRALAHGMAVGLVLAGLVGCARTSVENVRVLATGMPKPQLIVVHDFAVSPDAVSLEGAVGARLMDKAKGTSEAEERLKVGQAVARVVTENLVKEISKLGIPARAASAGTPAGSGLSVEGQFLSVDQGNRLRRAVVGFGAGASEVKALVQIYETTAAGRRLVQDFSTTAKSARRPGMGPMGAAGAAAGRAATSVAVSSGVTAATAHSQSVEGDATYVADEIAKVLKKFFVEQGWIAPE